MRALEHRFDVRSRRHSRRVGTVPYTVTDDPDTILYRSEVARWMETHWTGSRKCPVCENDRWEAEPRLFMLPRTPPYVGAFRPLFLIRCVVCSYVVMISASSAGIGMEPSLPDDLSELDEEGE